MFTKRARRALLAIGTLAVLLWAGSRFLSDPSGADTALAAPGAEPVRAGGERRSLEAGDSRTPLATSDEPREPPPVLRVLTVDDVGRPLGAVQLFARDDAGARPLAVTDAAGEARIEEPLAPWTQIVGHSPGYAAGHVRLAAPRPDVVRLALWPAATLAGRVEYADGAAAGAGLTVMAYRADMKLAHYRRGMDEPLLLDPETALTTTDADGRFQLEGLEPGTEYELLAGGAGQVAAERNPRHARPEDTGVVLVVTRGYGLLVRLVEPGGEPANSGAFFGAGAGFAAVAEDPSAYFLPQDGPLPWVAGLSTTLAGREPTRRLYLFGREGASDVEGVPFRLNAEPPGYMPVDITLTAAPLSEGLAEWPLVLHPRTGTSGTLVVERLRPDAAPGPARLEPFGVLGFEPLEGGARFGYSLWDPTLARHEVTGLPHGRYRVTLDVRPYLNAGSPCAHLGEVEIGPEPATVTVDPRGTGSVAFEVLDASGEPYQGALSLMLGFGEPELDAAGAPRLAGGQLHFTRPPYLLPIVAPRTYSVAGDASTPTADWARIDVAADERSIVRLRLIR